jgi:hypothetical protein
LERRRGFKRGSFHEGVGFSAEDRTGRRKCGFYIRVGFFTVDSIANFTLTKRTVSVNVMVRRIFIIDKSFKVLLSYNGRILGRGGLE